MPSYNPNPRIGVVNPVDDPTSFYYICLVDIPTAWGIPKSFGNGVVTTNGGQNTMTFTADIMFPKTEPGSETPFKSFLLPVNTISQGKIDNLAIQGSSTTNGGKKTGIPNNSAPVLR